MEETPERESRRPVIALNVRFASSSVYEPPGGGRIKIPLSTMRGTGRRRQSRFGDSGFVLRDPAKQDEVAASVLQRFPDDQLVFTRDLPELYASGVPALNVFIKVVVGVAAAISML